MPSQADRDRRDPRQARQCRLDQSLGQKTANPSLPRQRKRPLPICRTPLPRRAREAQTSRQNGKSLGSLRARASRQSAIRARARPRHDFPCRTARPDRTKPGGNRTQPGPVERDGLTLQHGDGTPGVQQQHKRKRQGKRQSDHGWKTRGGVAGSSGGRRLLRFNNARIGHRFKIGNR